MAAEAMSIAKALRGPAAADAADQLVRCAESIPANIAEGYGRGKGDDFARFLRISSSSAAEMESHLRVNVAVGRIALARVSSAIERARRVRALTVGLERYVRRRPKR